MTDVFGRGSDHLIEYHVDMQYKEGYKRAQLCNDPTTSKEVIAQAVLHLLKQINTKRKLD